MNTLTISQILINDCVKTALGLDKATFAQRVASVKPYAEMKAEAEKLTGADKVLALSALENLKTAHETGEINNFSLWDASSSGATWISILTRDVVGLNNVGAICEKPGNLYGDMVAEWNQAHNTKLTKLEWKLFTVPYYYGGDSNVKAALGEKGLEEYRGFYSKYLPGAGDFRQQCLDAWDSSADHYSWYMPDGFTVYMPVLTDAAKQKVSVKNSAGNTVSCEPMIKVLGPRKKGADHTRGLGASLIHSLDAYGLREMVRMAHLTKEHALDIINNKVTPVDDFVMELAPWKVQNALKGFKVSGIMSTRLFYLLDEREGKMPLPKHVVDAMKAIIPHLPDEEFELIHVHDEFGCLPVYVNDMRRNYNYICAQVYKGNLMKYYNKVLGMTVAIRAYDQAVYEALMEADYLLS